MDFLFHFVLPEYLLSQTMQNIFDISIIFKYSVLPTFVLSDFFFMKHKPEKILYFTQGKFQLSDITDANSFESLGVNYMSTMMNSGVINLD